MRLIQCKYTEFIYLCLCLKRKIMTEENNTAPLSAAEAVHIAKHVTWVGFWWNAFLGTAKIVAGVFGRSGALIADGIHSFSDFITDIIVIVMVSISHKKPNEQYEYGHGKYETFATMLLSVILIIVAVLIFWEGLDKVIAHIGGETLARPGGIALLICVLSIVVKEWLYRYTRRAGERINSGAVIANAWHHRSDAFSSVATLIGISGAMFLGQHWRILDPVAEMVVAIFIVIVGVKMAIPAVKELLEVALPEEMQADIRRAISTTPGVITFHHLRTRKNGKTIIIDVHIKVEPTLTVVQAHDISTCVESRISALYAQDNVMVTTHIEPYNGEPILRDGSCA